MKIGMIGLPQAGKKTLYELLTKHKPSEKEISSHKPVKGLAEIHDPRFDRLVSIYKPKKEVRARIDIELLPKLAKDTIAKGEIFADINELDAICHVVRVFKNDSVYHADGSVDPKRDVDFVNAELFLHDLIFIEKRLENLDKKIKQTKEEAAAKEKDLLLRLKAHLDKTLPLGLLELTDEDKKAISSYPLITRKAMLAVLNVSEDDLKNTQLLKQLEYELASSKTGVMQVSVKIESEIASLETEKEKEDFLGALGIEEPAMNMLTRLCIKTLDLVSFFTVGEDEVRQWLVRRGSLAPRAAGVIHSDMERGFIRAEVIKFADIDALGSEEKVKEAGKFYVKGKDYVVEDGDILNIRFSV